MTRLMIVLLLSTSACIAPTGEEIGGVTGEQDAQGDHDDTEDHDDQHDDTEDHDDQHDGTDCEITEAMHALVGEWESERGARTLIDEDLVKDGTYQLCAGKNGRVQFHSLSDPNGYTSHTWHATQDTLSFDAWYRVGDPDPSPVGVWRFRGETVIDGGQPEVALGEVRFLDDGSLQIFQDFVREGDGGEGEPGLWFMVDDGVGVQNILTESDTELSPMLSFDRVALWSNGYRRVR